MEEFEELRHLRASLDETILEILRLKEVPGWEAPPRIDYLAALYFHVERMGVKIAMLRSRLIEGLTPISEEQAQEIHRRHADQTLAFQKGLRAGLYQTLN